MWISASWWSFSQVSVIPMNICEVSWSMSLMNGTLEGTDRGFSPLTFNREKVVIGGHLPLGPCSYGSASGAGVTFGSMGLLVGSGLLRLYAMCPTCLPDWLEAWDMLHWFAAIDVPFLSPWLPWFRSSWHSASLKNPFGSRSPVGRSVGMSVEVEMHFHSVEFDHSFGFFHVLRGGHQVDFFP